MNMNHGSSQFPVQNEFKHCYLPASWLNKIKFIEHLLLNNNILISLIGQEGCGKTTFLRFLESTLSDQIAVYSLTVKPLYEKTELLNELSQAVLKREPRTLKHTIKSVNETKKHTLVLFDDAHYLSDDFITQLLEELKAQENDVYFHVGLCSNPSIVPRLSPLAHHDYKDMIHSIELGQMHEIEAKTFIIHRLLSQTNGFDNIKLDELYQKTNGNLAEMNRQLASESQSIKQAALPVKSTSTRRQAMMAAGVGLLASILVLSWQKSGTEDIKHADDMGTDAYVMVQGENTLPLPKTQPLDTNNVPATNEEVALVAQTTPHQLPINDSMDAANVYSEKKATPLELQLQNAMREDALSETKEAVIAIAANTVAIESTPIREDENRLAKIVKSGSKSNQFVTSRSSSHAYTIQLLASHNKKAIEAFRHAHRLDGKATIKVSEKAGQPWYVLTLGEYHERDSAKNAVAKLPFSLAKTKPWVRPLSDLEQIG